MQPTDVGHCIKASHVNFEASCEISCLSFSEWENEIWGVIGCWWFPPPSIKNHTERAFNHWVGEWELIKEKRKHQCCLPVIVGRGEQERSWLFEFFHTLPGTLGPISMWRIRHPPPKYLRHHERRDQRICHPFLLTTNIPPYLLGWHWLGRYEIPIFEMMAFTASCNLSSRLLQLKWSSLLTLLITIDSFSHAFGVTKCTCMVLH